MSRINPDDNDILRAAMGDLDEDLINQLDNSTDSEYNGVSPSNDYILRMANGDLSDSVHLDDVDVIDRQKLCNHEFCFAEQYENSHKEICRICGQERVVNDNIQIDDIETVSSKKVNSKKWISALVAVFVIAIVGGSVFALSSSGREDFEPTNQPESLVLSEDEQIEQEIATLDSVNNGFNEIQNKYLENGFVPFSSEEALLNEAYDYAEKLLESGIAKEISLEKSGCVRVETKDDYVYIFMPKLEGVNSGSGKNKIISLQPYYYKGKNKTADNVARDVEACCLDYSFDDNDNLDNRSVSIENVKKLKNSAIVIWDGHGGYTEKEHACLGTSLPYKKTIKNKNYRVDLKKHRLAIIGETICICGDFFDYYYKKGDFDKTLFFFTTCHSADDDYLAHILISKGASAVYANENAIYTRYIIPMMKNIFYSLTDYKTTGEALKIAKKKYGNFDVDYIRHRKTKGEKPAQVILFGNLDFQIISKPQDTTTHEEDLDDIPEVDQPEDSGENNGFVDKLCADEWYIAPEGDFTYFKFNNDGTVAVTSYVPEEKIANVRYDVIDDDTVYFGLKNAAGVTRITLTNRSEPDMVDIEVIEHGETIIGTMEWKSNLE